EVVEPFPTLGQELPDGAVGAERLQQLDLAVARGEQRRAHALLLDRRLAHEREAQRVPPEAVGSREALHRDPDVMDAGHHGVLTTLTLADETRIFNIFRPQAWEKSFSLGTGGIETSPAFSSTWARLRIPQSAVPTPGVDRTNWSARCASVRSPSSTWARAGGRFRASLPCRIDAEVIT